MNYADQLFVELQAGQIEAVHAPAAFLAALAVICSNVSQNGLDKVSMASLSVYLSFLEETSDYSPLDATDVDCGSADAILKAGVALLVEGTLELVGPWSVRQSDYCEPFPEVSRDTACTAASDAEFPNVCTEKIYRIAQKI